MSFSYDSRTPVLKDISFSLETGQSLGILGRTGSESRDGGADRGEGWNDAAELSLAQLRGSIGLVTQEVQLFRGTVRASPQGKPNSSPWPG